MGIEDLRAEVAAEVSLGLAGPSWVSLEAVAAGDAAAAVVSLPGVRRVWAESVEGDAVLLLNGVEYEVLAGEPRLVVTLADPVAVDVAARRKRQGEVASLAIGVLT